QRHAAQRRQDFRQRFGIDFEEQRGLGRGRIGELAHFSILPAPFTPPVRKLCDHFRPAMHPKSLSIGLPSAFRLLVRLLSTDQGEVSAPEGSVEFLYHPYVLPLCHRCAPFFSAYHIAYSSRHAVERIANHTDAAVREARIYREIGAGGRQSR